jgi:hypothetical protein
VGAGREHDPDLGSRYPGVLEVAEEVREDQVGRGRPGQVVDDYQRPAPASGKLAEGQLADRVFQG